MVDPFVIDAMLNVLRKHSVSKFQCSEYQLELFAEVPVLQEVPPDVITDPSDPDDGLYDHLSIKPTFPDKK